MDSFVSWFTQEGGSIDIASMGLADISDQGRGAAALQDILEGHTLFKIPRSLTLSTRTSNLPTLIGDAAWKSFQLHKGWVGLILCMMWEECRWTDSKWSGYFNILPRTFDTPMFWNEDELKELEGTDVPDKIGKNDAERDYCEKLLPAVQARSDLFKPDHLSTFYSLENYHVMGSRILSRSFHVEKWEGEGNEQDHDAQMQNSTETYENGHAMDVDDEPDSASAIEPENEDEEEGEGDDDDPSDVAMVPMADMLNARYGSENAKLFYEPTHLKMVTTKPIKRGEQICNTYGDPPNSALLRRYGHIDLIPFPDAPLKGGNPADVVELPADLAVHVVWSVRKDLDAECLKERIDWWLEEGGDDVFVVGTDLELPEVLVSFFKLLLLSSPDWEKTRLKGKPPKAKLDSDAKLLVLPLVLALFERRLAKYPTTLEYDEALLTAPESTSLTNNIRNAIIVRIGEKRILTACAANLQTSLDEAKTAVWGAVSAEKKRGNQNNEGNQRKRKRGKMDEEEKPRNRSGR